MEPSPLAPGGRRARPTGSGCRGTATPATDTARAPADAATEKRFVDFLRSRWTKKSRADDALQLALLGMERRPPTTANARARAVAGWLARSLEALRRVKKEEDTAPGVARGAYVAAPGMPGKRLGAAGRRLRTSHGAPGRQAASVRARLGGERLLLSRVLPRVACASVRACTHGLPLRHRRYRARVCPPSDAPGRQTDRFCGSKPVAWCCSTVASCLLTRGTKGMDWLARDFTCLSSSHAFFLLFACDLRERSGQKHTVHGTPYMHVLHMYRCQKLVRTTT